jgi:hypothetical protein
MFLMGSYPGDPDTMLHNLTLAFSDFLPKIRRLVFDSEIQPRYSLHLSYFPQEPSTTKGHPPHLIFLASLDRHLSQWDLRGGP